MDFGFKLFQNDLLKITENIELCNEVNIIYNKLHEIVLY